MNAATTGSSATTWREWKDAPREHLLLTEADLLNYPRPPALVDDLLLADSLALLVSPPGTGKSFIALDLALSIASGRSSFLGLPLRVKGPVVYIVGESPGGFRLRIKAWKEYFGVNTPIDFHWHDGPLNLLDPETVEQFIGEMERVRPTLIVVDTLSRNLPGADENSQQTMTQAVAVLDRIRRAAGQQSTILVLHHLNSSGTRERGSTVVKGAADTQLRLVPPKRRTDSDDEEEDDEPRRSPGRIKLLVEKQKELEELQPITLEQVVVTIPGEFDDGGRPSTSLVWVRSDTNRSRADRILAYARQHPRGVSKSRICAAVGGKRTEVMAGITSLGSSGRLRIEQTGKTHMVYPVQ